MMLDPETPDERRDQIASEARRRIESAGSLTAERAWGMRKLAYEIRQRTEADYRLPVRDREPAARRARPQPEDHRRGPSLSHLQGGSRLAGDRAASPVPLASPSSRGGGPRRGPGGRDDYEQREPAPAAPAPAPAGTGPRAGGQRRAGGRALRGARRAHAAGR